MKRTYIAGPMSGIPHFNFSSFFEAAARLKAEGYEVFNPAARDIERHGGVDISEGNLTGCQNQAAKQHGFCLRTALAEDMDWICRHATAIAMLPGWERSNGSRAEHALAVALGLEILYL